MQRAQQGAVRVLLPILFPIFGKANSREFSSQKNINNTLARIASALDVLASPPPPPSESAGNQQPVLHQYLHHAGVVSAQMEYRSKGFRLTSKTELSACMLTPE